MVWFTVDDGLTTNPKVLSIPRAERLAVIGLWTMAGSWSGRHLTDGVIPRFMLDEWGADEALADRLVEVGMWRRVSRGYAFCSWEEYQMSRAEVEARRERERVRKKEYRDKTAGQKGDGPAGVPASVPVGLRAESGGRPDTPSLPFPSLPYPVTEGTSRATRIPPNFAVSEEMVTWAQERTPLVDGARSTERFVNYFTAAPGQRGLKRDWVRTWRNWLLKDQEEAERRTAGSGTTWAEKNQAAQIALVGKYQIEEEQRGEVRGGEAAGVGGGRGPSAGQRALGRGVG